MTPVFIFSGVFDGEWWYHVFFEKDGWSMVAGLQYSIKNWMGPNPNGPYQVSCDRAIRYSGLGVRSVGPVGDFLEI